MTQQERLLWLIKYLMEEDSEYNRIRVPGSVPEQKRLLRSLMNVRPPKPVTEEFLQIQDAYLNEETREKGIVRPEDLEPVRDGIYLWQGDITRLQVDAVVNAANSALLGCFIPCHGCIDNAIHSAAGVQLRQECAAVMGRQGRAEDTGGAKITKAYNLPCRYVIHTVGPIVYGDLTEEDCGLLASCYQSCLELASNYGLRSIAFCCISTGEFHFPNEKAAETAIETVDAFRRKTGTEMEVIFNVFKDRDKEIYERLL
ncbi:protein-ADP-ribose hydrolase [Clostridium sp. AN503]|uniref:protein-ADP-ribose hydrolase n=1 Tax=Clostridium sp. AN503 TaxID=3160598 RepID=UPI003459B97B